MVWDLRKWLKIEKLSADKIKNYIDDEPNNNIVEITEVHNTLSEHQRNNESIIETESPKDATCKSTPKLTPYEKLVGQYTEGDVKMMNNVHEYIINSKPEKDFGDVMWINNCYNEDMNMRSQ